MSIPQLTDGELLRKLENLTSFERSSLVTVLHCLQEMKQRRLYSAGGFRSLFDYCVRNLRYPEDQAQRRIVAMRMLNELPEIEGEIARGSLSLTVIGLLDVHFRREGIIDRDAKLSFVRKVQGKYIKEVETELAKAAQKPRAHKPDSIRSLGETHIELRFVARASLEAKLNHVRGSLAHTHPHLGLGDLCEVLCDLVEKTNDSPPADPRDTPRRKRKRSGRPPLHRKVFTRDGHKCTLCGSTHALEVDHILPKAKGGSDTLDNLRLLCRSCNQRAAINEYGQEKMNQYL